jgi:indolepyruvate ferredoxin oxidoreductase beta subunit
MTTNVLLVGVGGQGTILASDILSEGLVQNGYDVKMSEIHGLAQRGGSVTTQIKFGDKVYSPVIGTAEADVLVSFEKIEAVRYLRYLKPEGTLIVNDYEIFSLPVLIGAEKYPVNVSEKLRQSVKHLKLFNAFQIAEKLGNPKVQSIVVMGAIIKVLKLEKVNWVQIMKQFVPAKLLDLNIRALQAGMNV